MPAEEKGTIGERIVVSLETSKQILLSYRSLVSVRVGSQQNGEQEQEGNDGEYDDQVTEEQLTGNGSQQGKIVQASLVCQHDQRQSIHRQADVDRGEG